MKLIYDKDFSKVQLEDIENVQEPLSLASTMVDSRLLPLIQEAERGDQTAMKELFHMFVHGTNRVKPNEKLAERYWFALHEMAQLACSPHLLDISLRNYAHMMRKFHPESVETFEAMLNAYHYMTTENHIMTWDMDFLDLVRNEAESYQYEGFPFGDPNE